MLLPAASLPVGSASVAPASSVPTKVPTTRPRPSRASRVMVPVGATVATGSPVDGELRGGSVVVAVCGTDVHRRAAGAGCDLGPGGVPTACEARRGEKGVRPLHLSGDFLTSRVKDWMLPSLTASVPAGV